MFFFVFFVKNKCLISIQTRTTQIEKRNISIENPGLLGFLKVVELQNPLPISFGTILVCNMI